MKVAGLQKLTLLDYPGVVACTVFTVGCNLRCPFCHNAPLVLPELTQEYTESSEILDFLKRRKGVLDGVAITGGEPLLHEDITEFLYMVKGLGYKIKVDTNGSFPEKLKEIVSRGLVDRVAMDIKNIPEKYAITTGTHNMNIDAITESKEFLMENNIEYEFRTTIVKGIHLKEDVEGMAKWIQGANEYYLQQFKDSGSVLDIEGLDAYDEKEMHELCDIAKIYVPNAKVRGV